MASDRLVEQVRLSRVTSAVARQMRDEALAARERCRDIVSQDRSLRHRINDRYPGPPTHDPPERAHRIVQLTCE